MSSDQDFREKIREYVGISESERTRKYDSEKENFPKRYREIINDYKSKPELMDIWDFLDKEGETIFGIKNWDVYRRAVGIDEKE
jgi:hypothetical protein